MATDLGRYPTASSLLAPKFFSCNLRDMYGAPTMKRWEKRSKKILRQRVLLWGVLWYVISKRISCQIPFKKFANISVFFQLKEAAAVINIEVIAF